MIEVAAAAKTVTVAVVMMVAEGKVMIEAAVAVTAKTVAVGNDGKGGGRRHIRGDTGL
jgi:hypothetical protein